MDAIGDRHVPRPRQDGGPGRLFVHHTAIVKATALLKDDHHCACGTKTTVSPAQLSFDFVAHLRTLRKPPPVRLCMRMTFEYPISVAVRTHAGAPLPGMRWL